MTGHDIYEAVVELPRSRTKNDFFDFDFADEIDVLVNGVSQAVTAAVRPAAMKVSDQCFDETRRPRIPDWGTT